MSVVLDASALLALLNDEPGANNVAAEIGNSKMSTVNWSEVVRKSIANNVLIDGMQEELVAIGIEFIEFSAAQAEQAGELWRTTRGLGLSLGDRACLALAAELSLPALTADRAWSNISSGPEIRQIR